MQRTQTRPAWCWRKRGVRREQHEGELPVGTALLEQCTLAGRLVSGDALYCQRAFCARVLAGGGDYLVVVKANQPQLYEAIVTFFTTPPKGEQCATAEHPTNARVRASSSVESA